MQHKRVGPCPEGHSGRDGPGWPCRGCPARQGLLPGRANRAAQRRCAGAAPRRCWTGASSWSRRKEQPRPGRRATASIRSAPGWRTPGNA